MYELEEKVKTEEIEESNQLFDLIKQAKKLELVHTSVNYFKYISNIYIIFILLYIIILLIYNFFFLDDFGRTFTKTFISYK